jgi:hypothetical protein
MIGNPLKSTPRYARLVNAGLRGEVPHIPDVGNGGMADAFFYNQARGIREKPLVYAAGALGTYALNQAVGNPIGGFVDAATFGITNFKPNESELIAMQPRQVAISQFPNIISMQPQQMTTATIPALNEESAKRQKEYLERKIATDLLTIQALQQQGQPQQYGY